MENSTNAQLENLSISKDALTKIADTNLPEIKKLQETMTLKGLSPNTHKTYLVEFAQLLYLIKDHSVKSLTPDQLRAYFLYCHNNLNLSENHIRSRINAVKFYFEQVLKREKFFVDIPRPKKPHILPKVLDSSEIKKLLSVCTNLKHKTILQLCYGMGLRVSEIRALKIAHINSARMQVLIASAKGKKDRYVNLPHSILESLRLYYIEYKPKVYLFEGQTNEQYSIRSIQAVFKQNMKKAGINKPIGIHSLRHSFATHLHEYGIDISFIQKLLGHSNIKTTLIYTQVSRSSIGHIASPLDRLNQ